MSKKWNENTCLFRMYCVFFPSRDINRDYIWEFYPNSDCNSFIHNHSYPNKNPQQYIRFV